MFCSQKAEKAQGQINIREAFTLWDLLNSKYMAVERVQIWENFAHDPDLKFFLKGHIKTLEANITILEGEMKRYSVKSSDRNRSFVHSSSNTQVVTDEFIALDIFLYLQEHMENLLKSVISTTTNDDLRTKIIEMTLTTIEATDKIIRYLLLKGWISTPPVYKDLPANVNVKIGVVEIANLWDHLALRYDNVKTTEIFASIVHDVDFKAILHMGLNSLQKQITLLEKQLKYFGAPLPKKPGKITLTISETEVLDDDYMYRVLMNAFQGAALLHAKSFKESTVCDKTRKIFSQLLKEEINIIDKFTKIGKIKGWLNPAPRYS
jgi:hypothetical protein